MSLAITLLLFAYLIGSIPFGYLIAKGQGIDIRTKGSGNIGATNVWRVMGKKFGLPCFVLDVLKGLVPSAVVGVLIAQGLLATLDVTTQTVVWLGVALASVIGHMFPVWLTFKGGKGVATSFGALLGIFPIFTCATLIALITWLISVKISRMVGISSCIAAIVLSSVVLALHLLRPGHGLDASILHVAFAWSLAIVVIIKHRGNLARTFAGTERKIGAPSSS